MASYVVPEEFGGMSLSDLRRKRSEPFRSDVLAGFLGINEKQPLTAGQKFNFSGPGGSAEAQFLSGAFTPLEQYNQAKQDAFVQEQRGRLGEFTNKLGEIPDQLAAVRQALGIPEAYQTYQGAGETARGIGNLVRDIPESVRQTLSGQGVNAGQIAGKTAQEVKELQPALESATRGLESSGATLGNLLSQYQTETANIFTPLQMEAGLLGDSAAQEFSLFKTNIAADLDRELANLSRQTQLDIADMNRAMRLAEIEQATQQGQIKDFGDRYELINPFTGESIKTFSKGLAPTRGGGETDISKYLTLNDTSALINEGGYGTLKPTPTFQSSGDSFSGGLGYDEMVNMGYIKP